MATPLLGNASLLKNKKARVPKGTPPVEVVESPAFVRARDFTEVHEGGYSNDPADKGGETNFGVSKKAYPKLNIKNLKRDQARAIYKQDYWDKIKGDSLPSDISMVVFDHAVNAGVGNASKHLQLLIGSKKVDGIIGSRTLAQLSRYLVDNSSHDLALKLLDKREWFYKRLAIRDSSQSQHLGSWLGRVNELRKLLKDEQGARVQTVSDQIAYGALPEYIAKKR